MSLLTALARMEALRSGRAVPLATVRHVRLAEHPVVLVPLRLAGEAAAPLAVMAGSHREKPRLFTVPQPRNRDLRFAFFADLAGVVMEAVATAQLSAETLEIKRGERKGETYQRFLDAPQLLVPNRGGIEFLRLTGRSTRFRQAEGEWPVPEEVPLLGRWLTWFADRSDYPGSSVLCAMTDLLSLHWATGQSPLEDGNLAAQLGWISPPEGRTGLEAAREAEDPLLQPPAGPATDPSFDNEVLAPLIAAYDLTEEDGPARAFAAERVAKALATQLEPTWELMWRGVELLRSLPVAAGVPQRFEGDRQSFTTFEESLAEGAPQARRDGAVAAARRLASLEGAASRYAVQRALDDPLVLAEHRLTGEAFLGEVVWTDPDNVNSKGLRRPLVQIATDDRLRVEPGKIVHNAARTQKAEVLEVADGEVLLRIENGMGNSRKPNPGSIPEPGDRMCFTTFTDEFRPSANLPEPEETPWTHGGPPEAYEPPNETTAEEMSHESA
ncbi:hypothetical protein [Actinocorallia libanotica]|uniref:Uncharacterized protein n=1 Tax=Actinocorallia libanotica TaxID=46162 RepID=A0ABN1RNU6_9ACTN